MATSKRSTPASPKPGSGRKQAVITLIPDEMLLAKYERHVQKVCASFATQYKLGDATREDWEQELRITLIKLPMDVRVHGPYVRTSLNNRARHLLRMHLVRERRVLYGEGETTLAASVDDTSDLTHADHTVVKLLSALTPVQRQIVVIHLGLDTPGEPGCRNWRKIARLVGVSERRARAEFEVGQEAMKAKFDQPDVDDQESVA